MSKHLLGRTAALLGCGLLLGLTLHAQPAVPEQKQPLSAETLRVRKIELVDEKGVVRGVLEARSAGSATLALHDPDHDRQVNLSVAPEHGPRLLLLEGDSAVAHLEVEKGGQPVLILQPSGKLPRTLRP
ncbi:MAG: hypothetical protein ACK47B_13475 [Armatimonadota bacterium]